MRRIRRLLAGAAVASLGVAALGGEARAETSTFVVTSGNVNISGVDIPFGGIGISTAQWDTTTGFFDFELNVVPFPVMVDSPLGPLEIVIDVTQIGSATGNLDPDTGAGTLGLTISISLANELFTGACSIGPFSIDLSTDAPGSPLADDAIVWGNLGATIPGVVDCAVGALDVSGLINDELGLPSTQTSTVIAMALTDEEIPPPPPPTTPTVPPVAELPPTGGGDTAWVATTLAGASLLAGAALLLAVRRRQPA